MAALDVSGAGPDDPAIGVVKVRRLWVLVAAVALAACAGPSPTGTPAATTSPVGISVANGTTVPVAIAVNGTVVETVPPGTDEAPLRAALPARPWSVEARSPSGRVLAAFAVPAGDAVSGQASVGAIEDLACGTLAVWAGGPRGDHPRPSGVAPKPCD